MTLTDRTRKILWGRSGNRCALCRHLLSVDGTQDDPASVVGDECHIVGQSPHGPRACAIAPEMLDSEENLILLCRTDHKRVDDQTNYFSSARLRAIKTAHEAWVHTTLATRPPQSFEARIRAGDSRTQRLRLIATGSELYGLVAGAMAYDFDHDDLRDDVEVDLVAGFLQSLQEHGEAGDDLESGDRVRARFALAGEIKTIEEAGFVVFGSQMQRALDLNDKSLPWPVAVVRVKRFSDLLMNTIKEVEAEDRKKGKAGRSAD